MLGFLIGLDVLSLFFVWKTKNGYSSELSNHFCLRSDTPVLENGGVLKCEKNQLPIKQLIS